MPDPDWGCFDEIPAHGGLVVAVDADAGTRDWRGWGSTEPGGSPLGLDSPFYAGSIAKQFTAACVVSLIADEDLALDSQIRELLPELPASLDGVEVRHLLHHTSGLPDGNTLDRAIGFDADADAEFDNADRLLALEGVELESPPGEVHRYNNYGYVLLAEAVRSATGQPLGEYATRHLIHPAGMATSGFLDVSHPEPVSGWSDGRRIDIRFRTVGDGGLVTTVADLLRWGDWLRRSRLAPLMLGPRPVLASGDVAHDAWGISIRPHHGLRIESHGGSFDGYLCSMVRFPSERLTFVAMSNTNEPGPAAFSDRLRRFVDSTLGDRLDLSAPAWNASHGLAVD